MMRERFGLDLDAERSRCVFVRDSPNDAPMFAFFPNAVGVQRARLPRPARRAAGVDHAIALRHGLAELARMLIDARSGATD